MGGKEREHEPPPATDDEDATQATTQEGDHGPTQEGVVGESSGKRSRQHSITRSPLGSQAAQSEGPPPCRKGSGRRNE